MNYSSSLPFQVNFAFSLLKVLQGFLIGIALHLHIILKKNNCVETVQIPLYLYFDCYCTEIT